MISIKTKNPLFTYYSRLVNILDFNPKKLSIEKVCAINDKLERIYYVKYDKDPFYLIIDDLKDYFKYSKEKDRKELAIGYILDFNPKKLSIEKVCAINDKLERIYYVKYDKDPFYLIIDDLKDYFKYSKEKDRKELEFIIADQREKKL